MDPILSVEHVSVRYGSNEVLHDVTFSAEKGDYIALAGPNGAGKTTLAKTIIGLVGKYAGTIRLFGKDTTTFKDWNRIGYLPQRVSAFNPLFPATAKEVVGLGLLSEKGFPRYFDRRDEDEIGRVLNLMGISDLKDKLIGELSGGQQQRVFLARSLVSNPELLILDEPSTALDPSSRESFLELLKKLNREIGITVLLITHDTSQIGKYADKLLYLDKKVIFFGGFADFCRSEEMGEYFGRFSQHLICHQHD
ncbi:MAG TPA: metal ABC transporter ATP-binding protein [Deltaproteobacteria bacterium]|jgi:zinc transport system ATP-binding protein|nr:metal ABC transporter ATP-binding protein [Deltaproteobacteria bacterium]HQI01122.1 metal ABC transporter ATP-binding protein [Deltaproteobacteria bacterium]